ncbi:phage tail protein [Pseudomonas sp. Root68]|uniref:phage tail tape measure protein n=1 Tax=unclassified Pseudomonas TaxID=196821 RepID=UPI0007021999|nr:MULTISPECIES: phage tail tape measure protein [unclassified Pseudomonas]KRA95876.1 phage tail protein [Pseudomonas sp. Root68]KRB66460.1 phage tail protein [Pseudomonas sp. Root71]
MANKLSLGLVIGGAVDSSLGAAFKNVSGEMKKLEAQTTRAKGLQKVIGETIRLRDEWKKAHDSGAANADALLRKLETNTSSLRKQGVEVGRLRQEYLALGKVVRSAEFKAKGMGQVEEGRESLRSGFGTAVAGTTLAAVPTKVSADFQAIIRDIAIKSGTANTQQEVDTARDIVQTSKDSGMANTQVADLVNQLVGGGMELAEALKYAPVAAKFAVGQGASGTDTAKMILAMQNNAKITDPKKMEQALASVALLGQQGSFEAADMAKWFPELLAQMAGSGITGQEAVTQLGAMLQVQIKSAGSADEAANNLKNWIAKIGSGETVKGYADAGIDYQGSMNAAIAKGLSTFEASFELARRYVEKTDPKKAKQLDQGLTKISQETDPAKAQAMADALAATLRTGDVFADMQVKTALMAYTQNKKLYADLKRDAANPNGQRKDILDKNLNERRESSSQRWAETGQAFNDSLRAIGDALRPATDALASGIGAAARGLTALSEETPKVVLGLAALSAGALLAGKAWAALKIGRGLVNIARGSAGDRSNIVQRVFVTNANDGDDDGVDHDSGRKRKGPARRPSRGMKVGGALAVVGAGVQMLDTYQNAITRDEKAEGYGEAAGGLAGGLAGAAAGAAIGSVIPLLGTAVGGMIGAWLGAMGGGDVGATMGKTLFGGPDIPVVPNAPLGLFPMPAGQGVGAVVRAMDSAPAAPVTAAALMSSTAAKTPEWPKVDQQFTFAPAPVFQVHGDVKDPAQLVQELMPYLRRQFEDFAREARARQLFDAPHVG